MLSVTLTRSVSLTRSYTFHGTLAALSERNPTTARRFGCVRYSSAASMPPTMGADPPVMVML